MKTISFTESSRRTTVIVVQVDFYGWGRNDVQISSHELTRTRLRVDVFDSHSAACRKRAHVKSFLES